MTVTPYVVLVVLIAHVLGADWGAWERLLPTLVLCLAAVLLIILLRDLPTPWRGRQAAVVALMAGMITLNLALVLQDSWFGFMTVVTFSFAYSLIEWPWQLLAVAATATVAGIAQSSGFAPGAAGTLETLGVVALNIVVMCGMSWGLQLSRRNEARAVTDAERARMAREIHDTLAQGFAGIVTQLQAGEQAPDEASRRRHTDAALALARDGLAEARRSVHALRPTALDAVRLPEALGNVARSWSARTGIPVRISTAGDASGLGTDAEVALLRTAQEALTNIERHAQAHEVVLTLRSDADGIRLEVRDDGRGFDPAAQADRAGGPDAGGYGLVAMRERLESVAGRLAVESQPGQGAAIRAEIPA